MKNLECTLRDGGYYCAWNFDNDLISSYLDAMDALRIDYVELGFRSAMNKGFKGGLAFTTDAFLNSLTIPKGLQNKIAVMVNGSEIANAETQKTILESLFSEKLNSPVSLVRIACHFHEFEACLPASEWLKEKGYKVGFNLMQVADRSLDEITELALKASRYPVDVLYFADSMGSLNPKQVVQIIQAVRNGWKGELGIHTHDNMGMAIQNTLVALEHGVTWVDSTVTGMGRGPGNAQTEFLAVALEQEQKRLGNPTKLFEIVRKYFKPMQQQYGWGTNPYYYLAGKYGIHPSYVQEMLQDSRYNDEDILAVLEHLRIEGGKKFSLGTLSAARHFYSGEPRGSWNPKNEIQGRSVLVIGSGPSVKQHQTVIEEYIKRQKPYVIALNTQSSLSSDLIDVRAACHPVRLLADCHGHMQLPQPLITPYTMLPVDIQSELKDKSIFDFGIEVSGDKFSFKEKHCVIPNSLVISYVLAIANSGLAKQINLVGFDGYSADDGRAQEMEQVLRIYNQTSGALPLCSLTETRYEIETQSIYGF